MAIRRSATDILQDILFAAALDAVAAFKAASRNVPNALLRDLNAVHPNTTLADLPPEVQQAIAKSVRDAFARLLKEGYAIGPATPGAPPERPVTRDVRAGPRPPRGRPGKPPIVETKRPPRRTGPPPPKRP